MKGNDESGIFTEGEMGEDGNILWDATYGQCSLFVLLDIQTWGGRGGGVYPHREDSLSKK